MYARVTRLEVPLDKMDRDIALNDATARSVTDAGGLGMYYLTDRETGRANAISLWPSEQAMHDSEALAETNKQQRIAETSANVVSVERYEVVVEPATLPSGKMPYARVSRYEVPAEKREEDISHAEETKEKVASMPGSLGLYYLADRASGKTMSITLWESEQAMRDSETSASQLRAQTSGAVSARITGIERYEVVYQPAAMPAART
ncbi:MAG TPA: antibiotic biosynthesis monooxygenase [Coriobacteriia bacterium]